jgi:hypothetical protein
MKPRNGTLAFQPDSGQGSSDTCIVRGNINGKIGEPPRNREWPSITKLAGPSA